AEQELESKDKGKTSVVNALQEIDEIAPRTEIPTAKRVRHFSPEKKTVISEAPSTLAADDYAAYANAIGFDQDSQLEFDVSQMYPGSQDLGAPPTETQQYN
ncbi:unnamed protein product, partial [Prorocentrum cordatum]